ncbi:hypothetical protein Q5741_12305 [Paenibacillus sp. JX-17]|uniref:O-antigen ligase domain-containing protein n=1 Tax=Paenibacillus lacisoli TaxID=3064525 RepID=A0ABT9CD76_9BACL|nr:hypothetical protein [Paenibacillus sp. JX-17]MDO7907192.1 hypothetical protein [Paenibacillus sp. JX-17]
MVKAIRFFSLLFLIFIVIPFLPQAVYNIMNHGLAHIKFYEQGSFLNLNFRFVKDVIMIVLLGLFLLHDLIMIKTEPNRWRLIPYYLLAALTAYGVCVMNFQEQNVSMVQVVAGIRSLLLVLLCYKVLRYLQEPKFRQKFNITLAVLIVVEFVVLLLQYITFFQVYGLTNPFSLRLIGTYGSFSTAGYFGLGASCYIFMSRSFRFTPVLQVLCFAICMFSGTRSALLGVTIIMAITLFRKLLESSTTSHKRDLYMILLSLGSVGSYFLIQFMSMISERGSIVGAQVEGGRIEIFLRVFKENTLAELIFGKGMGFGTNAVVNTIKETSGTYDRSQIMDGTLNSLLVQYGLILVALLCLYLLHVYVVHFKTYNTRRLEMVTLVLVCLLMCSAINIFEQFTFLFLFFVSFYLVRIDPQPASIETAEDHPVHVQSGSRVVTT